MMAIIIEFKLKRLQSGFKDFLTTTIRFMKCLFPPHLALLKAAAASHKCRKYFTSGSIWVTEDDMR